MPRQPAVPVPVVVPSADKGLDLLKMIRETIAETDLDDPGVIAQIVAERIPLKHVRAALAIALRDMVRIAFHSSGSWLQPIPTSPAPAGTGTKGGPAPTQRQPFRSTKVQGWQTWGAVLFKREAVKGNVWKKFGDCNVEDLQYLEESRRSNAEASLAAAERFEKY